VTVSKTVDVNSNSTIELELSLSNTSGSDITIAEIGYKQEFSASTTQSGTTTNDYVFLIDRTVLSSPATIAAGGSAVITYSLTTKFGASGGVTDVEVDGVSVVTGGVAEIDLTGKQDTLIAGTNISIAADGKTISASGGTTVVANPSGTGTADLNKLQVGSDIYDIPSASASTLAGLTDTNISTPTDGQYLTYDGTSSKWVNTNGGGSGSNVFLSDYYSETERVVGTYLDGKPLYQKSFDIGSSVSIGANTWYDTAFKPSDYSMEKIPRIFSVMNDNTDPNLWEGFGAVANRTTDKISIVNMRPQVVTVRFFTLQYTKTTDAAGTGPSAGNIISLPSIYSEQEREIGVWTDGKPLYQITVNLTGSFSGNDVTLYTASSLNIDKLIDLFGVCNASSYSKTIEHVHSNNNYSNGIYIDWSDGAKIKANIGSSTTMENPSITLLYTKTTDTPGSGTWQPDGTPSHIYSTTPHKVGKWIDGSDVWECTHDFSASPIALTRDTWVTALSAQTQINQIIKTDVICGNFMLLYCEVSKDANNSNINIKSFDGTTRNLTHLVIQYTKT
jgi:hypothetical protein